MEYNLGPYRIRPRGEYKSTVPYKYLDIVTYNGSSYLCIYGRNETADANIEITGKIPDDPDSSLYWQLIASKGDKGLQGDANDLYRGFITVTDGIWDYSKSDKIIVPEDGSNSLILENIYDGCCGIILSEKELVLPPNNSNLSSDFYYISKLPNQLYLYTFICARYFNDTLSLFWNRTVVNKQWTLN